MRAASGSIQTLLSGSNVVAQLHLYTLTLLSGSVLRWTDADADVSYGGNVYASIPIRFDAMRSVVGLEIASARVAVGSQTLIAGVALHVMALRASFDNATLRVERCYLADFKAAIDPVLLFVGVVEEVRPTPSATELLAKSKLVTLRRPAGRVIQPSCPYQLGDAACGVNLATYQEARTAASGSTTSAVNVTVAPTLAVAAGWVTFTSGLLAGQRATIAGVSGSTLTLAVPLVTAPTAGDGLTITRGCDKTRQTCRTVFSNLARFGGFADIPADDEEV